MKKLIALTAALMLGVGLIAAPAQATPKRDQDLYVKLVRQEAPELRQVKRKELINAARTTCRYLRAGGGILDAVSIGIDSGLKRNTSIAVVAGAVVFFCPEQEANY